MDESRYDSTNFVSVMKQDLSGGAPKTQDDATGRKRQWQEGEFTVIRGNARTAPGCHDNCGLLMYVKDGKLDHVEGDPEDPYNQGRLCVRCFALPDFMYHEDRQLYPMKRAKENRGKDRWERITWDEAYAIIKRELDAVIEKYTAKAIQVFCGTGRDIVGYHPLLSKALGTPNQGMGFLSGQSCYVPRNFSTAFKIGELYEVDYSQYWADRYDHPGWLPPEYVVVWGNNPVVANSDGTLGHWLVDCMKRGTKLITIDPKLTWCAAHSEYWLQVRPGTDAALALAFGNILTSENLVDTDFIEKWTYGYDEYKEEVKQWTPERVAEICEVDADLIYGAARALGNAERWGLQWGVALDHTEEGFYSGQACWDLLALCGQFEKPGGMVSGKAPFGIACTWVGADTDWIPEIPEPGTTLTGGYPALGVMGMPSPDETLKEMETDDGYPVKACWIQTNNPISNMGAEPERIKNALQRMDFNVVVDLWMTPTAMACADIFLPVTCFPERPGLTGHQPYRLGAINKAVEPLGETRSDQRIIYEMGRMFAGEDVFPWHDEESFYDFMLRNTGFTYKELSERSWAYPVIDYYRYETGGLRDDGQPGFNTTTGRYEFWSTGLAHFGMSPLATYKEPPEGPISTPELMEEYPLILTTGARQWGFFHSEGRNIPHLRALHPDPEVTIHPETAAKYGIEDGDWVVLENKYGSCRQKAKLDIRIKKNVVSADHGWWFPERKDQAEENKENENLGLFGTFESNCNNLLLMRPGSTGLGNSYKSGLCKISKAEA